MAAEDTRGGRGDDADAQGRGPERDAIDSTGRAREVPLGESPVRGSRRERARGVLRHAGWIAGGIAVGLAIGFVPQWLTARDLRERLGEATYELEVARLQATLGAALAEADRGNYERARQLASTFYMGLEGVEGSVRDEAQAGVVEDIALGRDEVITLLSRAAPEARSRLAILYTQYFAAMEPLGREHAASLTTTPVPGGSEADSNAGAGVDPVPPE